MLMNRKTQYYTMSVVSKLIYRFNMNSMKIPPGILQSKLISILKCIYKVKGTKTVSSVQSLSHVRLFATPWTGTRQASLSTNNCRSLPKPMSTESVMPSNHLILCCPLLLLPSIFPSISMTLDGPVRKERRSTRLQLTFRFINRDTAVVKLKDIGFGEFYKTNYRVWEQILKI